ncbi:hypothetical protein HUB97_02120 [Halorubraceae archaeon YAN]|nr:hypothetical protein [Halorubraceae archaeon YAN]
MTEEPASNRRSPVGAPVVRADPEITGERAAEAIGFDPDDPESVAEAAKIVRQFSENTVGADDNVIMLRGAAACAALVRGVGSYKAAAERAGGDVSVSFIRKWARVHDLPQAIRRHVARGHIAPTAAKHIARVPGEARYAIAWAVLDGDLTVRDVRSIASDVNDGTPVEDALRAYNVIPGALEIQLPLETYIELRRVASMQNQSPDEIVSAALSTFFADKTAQ